MKPLLEVENLRRHFVVERSLFGRPISAVKAVDGVSFALKPADPVALVGESGCGKTTLGRLVLRLIEPQEGRIVFDGRDTTGLKENELRGFRRHAQLIFQDPYASLNPRMTVGQILLEPLFSCTMSFRLPAVSNALPSCCAWSACRRRSLRSATRTNFLEASASASPLRARRRRAQTHHLRRAGVGARCLHPRPGAQPATRPAAALWPHLHLHFARSRGSQAHRQQGGGDKSRQIVGLAPAHELFASPKHPYTRALLSAIPVPNPQMRRNACSCTANCPAPWRRRPDAGFIPAARLSSSAAGQRLRPCDLTKKGMPPPATASASCRRSSHRAAPASPRN